MKVNKKGVSLLGGVLFFVVGLIIFMDPEIVVKFISYFFGGMLILVGLYKTANYYIQDKRLGVVNQHELAFGITAIILGIIFIFLADAIELLLRIVVGGWIITSGLRKISATFYTTERNAKFYSLLVVGLLLISVGLYIILVSNIAFSLIGALMAIYGFIDIISYFIYRTPNDKEIIEEKVFSKENEIIIEAELEEEKPKKSKKKTKKTNK